MKTFRIISTSWVLAIFSSLAFIFLSVFFSYWLFRQNQAAYWITIVSFIALSFYLQRFISRAEIIIVLTEEFLTIEWKKQYIFHKRPDRQIPFTEIQSYKYQPDSNFDLLRITLLDGTELNFWHSSFTKDDFAILVSEFSGHIDKFNKKAVAGFNQQSQKSNTPAIIEREKTIFESEAAPVLAILAILFIVGFTALIILKPGDTSGYVGRAAVVGGASFYLAQYFKYRRKNDKKDKA